MTNEILQEIVDGKADWEDYLFPNPGETFRDLAEELLKFRGENRKFKDLLDKACPYVFCSTMISYSRHITAEEIRKEICKTLGGEYGYGP